MTGEPRQPGFEKEQEVIGRIRKGLSAAAEAITGNPDTDPLLVFPDPADAERREDIKFAVPLNAQQEAAFREAMAGLGLGRKSNWGAEEAGLETGYLAFLEGGQGHKMLAELNLAVNSRVRPGMIILSGDSGRILPEDERNLTAKVLGREVEDVGENEYEVAKQVFAAHPQFEAVEPVTWPIGFDQSAGVSSEPTGQFTMVGKFGTASAVVMRIDRDQYPADDGSQKFHRLDNRGKLAVLRNAGMVGQVGFATSSTYQPSIEIDTLAMSQDDFDVRVISYGMDELASVKGEPSKPPSIDQLAAEAYKTAQQLVRFEG